MSHAPGGLVNDAFNLIEIQAAPIVFKTLRPIRSTDGGAVLTSISRLRVGNEDFLVTSMIERCPRSMMMRELIKNAIEAATAGEEPPTVEVRAAIIGGVRKLAIRNSGPGMSSEELVAMCDIASSIRKANGLSDNFGMGAKVATLPSNAHGVRYRSSRAGHVSQVVMGRRGEVYGRLLMVGPDGSSAEVLDVTGLVAGEDYGRSHDWTEVVLLGDRAEQDTVADPYNGDPAKGEGWIAEALFSRFFTLPPGLLLTLDAACGGRRGAMSFQPLSDLRESFTHYEAVTTPDGVVIHYLNDDGALDGEGGAAPAGGPSTGRLTASLIHRGEIYETVSRTEWNHEAPRFGITFGAKTLAVLVELPDDFAVRTDGYRQMLHYVGNLQHRVTPRDFAGLVSTHRPEWLLELQRRLGPDRRRVGQHRLEMEALFRSLQIRRRWSGAPEISAHANEAADGGEAATRPPEAAGAEDEVQYEVAPEIIALSDPSDIEERGLQGKAARFYPETHQLFVNELYQAFADFRRILEQQNTAAPDQDQVRRLAHEIASTYVTRAVCRTVAFGIAKRDLWQPWEIETALSTFALSLSADAAQEMQADAAEDLRTALSGVKAPDPITLEPPGVEACEAEEDLDPYDPADGPRIILPSYMRRRRYSAVAALA